MFEGILRSQFTGKPAKTLYHYTNYSGFLSIAKHSKLRLSEVRHLNDSMETKELSRWINDDIHSRKDLKLAAQSALTRPQGALADYAHHQSAMDFHHLLAFNSWLISRFGKDELAMFVGSFTERGNLLSQWRGYCAYGKGVSLGFKPKAISECAKKNSYLLGRCIYTAIEKKELAKKVVDEVIQFCRKKQQSLFDYSDFGATSYFDDLECNLLTISSLVKNSSFKEEVEWRVVVPAEKLHGLKGVEYREGKNSLIPYVEFDLPQSPGKKLELEKIYIGPTPQPSLSLRALNSFIVDHVTCSKVLNTHSPYRE